MINRTEDAPRYTPYIIFSREEWRSLRDSTPLTITKRELDKIRGINENISLSEVEDIYLPLSRLLNLYFIGSRELRRARSNFLGKSSEPVPFIIGIAGSVAVGKSTISRLLKTLISAWPEHPSVELIPTDGFLYPNSILEEKNLMDKKGFPESYDLPKLISFLYKIKSGESNLKIPVYSHIIYDIIPGKYHHIGNSDIILLEGLNVLQTKTTKKKNTPEMMVSDFFDFSIYIDADERYIRRWYIDRFKVLQKTAFTKKESYFRRYSTLSDSEAEIVAGNIWDTINYVNLKQNIEPTKYHSDLILLKRKDHSIDRVMMRKI